MTRFFHWGCVLAWAALMFTLSTDTFSSQHTLGIVVRTLHSLAPSIQADTLELLNKLVRKCAHLCEYFVFGWLLLQAVRGGNSGWKLRWAILALMLAAGYACLDEFHQSFVPSRTASGWDVLLDTTGASMAQIAVWATVEFSRRGQEKSGLEAIGPKL
jgi:VanZ family protein